MTTEKIFEQRSEDWQKRLKLFGNIRSGYTYTPEEAKSEFDIDLESDWGVQVIPWQDADSGYGFQYVTPEGWRITPGDEFISPTGESYTRERIQQQQAAYGAELERYKAAEADYLQNKAAYDEWVSSLGDYGQFITSGTLLENLISRTNISGAYPGAELDLAEWVNAGEDDITQAIRKMFGLRGGGLAGMDTEDTLSILRLAALEDPEKFTQWFSSLGLSKDTQLILQAVSGLEGQELENIYGITNFKDQLRPFVAAAYPLLGDRSVEMMVTDFIYNPENAIQDIKTGGWSIEKERLLRVLSPGMTDLEAYEFFYGTYDPGFFGKMFDALKAGSGDFQATVGSVVKWLGAEQWGQTTIDAGRTWQQVMAPDQGIGWDFVRMLPTQLWILVVSKGLGWGAGGLLAGTTGKLVGGIVPQVLTGLGPYATYILKSVGMASVSRGLESSMEAGGAYEQALSLGMSREEASDVAFKVFNENLKLVGVDAVQFTLALLPFSGLTTVAPKLITQGLFRYVGKGLGIAGVALTEGGEEYYQEIIQRQALGEDISAWAITKNLRDEDILHVTMLGAMGGAAFAGGTEVISIIKNNVIKNLREPQLEEVNKQIEKNVSEGATQMAAEMAALNTVAETTEGQEIIDGAIKAAQAQWYAGKIVTINPVMAERLNTAINNMVAESKLTNIPRLTVNLVSRIGRVAEQIAVGERGAIGGEINPQEVWDGLSSERRANLAKEAGLDPDIANKDWSELSEKERQVINKFVGGAETLNHAESLRQEYNKLYNDALSLDPNNEAVVRAGQILEGITDENLKEKLVQFDDQVEEALRTITAGKPVAETPKQKRRRAKKPPKKFEDSYNAQDQIDAINEVLATDPVANWKTEIIVTRKGKQITRKIGLESFISIKEKEFPPYLTLKQASQINPSLNLTPWKQKDTKAYNRVPREIVLEELGATWGMTTDQIADRVKEISILRNQLKEYHNVIRKQMTETPLEAVKPITEETIYQTAETPGKPGMTLEEAEALSGFLGEYILSEDALSSYELQRQLRGETFQKRIEQWQQRTEELIVEGMSVEEAWQKAKEEALTGKLPVVEVDYFDQLTDGLREALFTMVYNNETLSQPRFYVEKLATLDALTRAITERKALNRKRGRPEPGSATFELYPEGSSQWDRLNFVFGKHPDVMKAIERMAEDENTLRDVVEKAVEEDVYRPQSEKKGAAIRPDKKAADNIEVLFRYEPTGQLGFQEQAQQYLIDDHYTPQPPVDNRTPAEQLFAQKKMDLRIQRAKGEITEDEYKLKLKIEEEKAFPPPSSIKYEPPISDAFEQYPLMTELEKGLLTKILKELAWSPVDIGNFLRANKASVDFSFWRQVSALAFGHPLIFGRANIEAFKALFSQGAAEAHWQKITQDPDYELYEHIRKKYGPDPLRPFIPRKGSKQWETSEEFGFAKGGDRLIPKLTAKIPWIKISQRSFETGTNTVAWQCWKNYIHNARMRQEQVASGKVVMKSGEAFDMVEEMRGFQKMLADLIQRGSLGSYSEISPIISGLFFAPRAAVGRFLTPRHLLAANPRVRLEAWRNLGSFVGVVSSVLALGYFVGAWDLEKDPRSGEYMTIRIGNTRVDPWAGYKQFAVLYARIISGTGISSVTGQEYKADPFQSVVTFIRSKASPLAQLILDFVTGKTFFGEEVGFGNAKQWIERLAPFMIWDVYEAASEGGWTMGLTAALPAWVGLGVQTYTGDWKENWQKLGTPKYIDNLRYGIKNPVYDTSDFWADTVGQFKGVDVETLTVDRGYPAYIQAIVEADRIQDRLENMPSQSLISLNADPSIGTTFQQYYQMWQEYQAAEDKDSWVKEHPEYKDYYMGNMSSNQYTLLIEYHSLTSDYERAKFLERHPELAVNPRTAYLQSHSLDNAKLAVWGQAQIYTKEAYNEVKRIASELGIPDSALPTYTLPPETSLDNYFTYQDMVAEGKSNSWEAQLLLANDNDLRIWLGRAVIMTPLEALEIKTQPEYRSIWNKLNDEKDPEWVGFIEDEDERESMIAELRDTMIGDMTYGQLEYKLEAIEKGTVEVPIPEEIVDAHIRYFDILNQGESVMYKAIEAKLFLIDNPEYKAFRYDDKIWSNPLKEDIDINKVSMWRLLVANRDQEIEFNAIRAKYKDMADERINATGAPEGIEPIDWLALNTEQKRSRLIDIDEQKYREANPVFANDMYRIKAYENEIPADYFNTYVDWLTLKDQGKLDGWEDDWFMLEHINYHNNVWVKLFGNDPYPVTYRLSRDGVIYLENKDGNPSHTPPTRDLGTKYAAYQEFDNQLDRDQYRLDNPDLDEWGVAVGIWDKTMSERRKALGLTTTEREIAELLERYEDWQEILAILSRR